MTTKLQWLDTWEAAKKTAGQSSSEPYGSGMRADGRVGDLPLGKGKKSSTQITPHHTTTRQTEE